jgi:hypothetical protein
MLVLISAADAAEISTNMFRMERAKPAILHPGKDLPAVSCNVARCGDNWRGCAAPGAKWVCFLRQSRKKHTHFACSGAKLRTLQLPWQELFQRYGFTGSTG